MLWTLAFDHRNSLRTQFLGLAGPPTAADEAACRRVKQLAFDALAEVVHDDLGQGRAAFLVDEEYGASIIEQAKDAGIAVIVPVEVSGRRTLAFEHGDRGFGPNIERLDPTLVKVLVRYHPDDDRAVNAQQGERLGALQRWLDDHGRDWMLELLVPSPEGRPPGPAEQARWDVEDRPGLTVRAIAQLVEVGVRPAFWKLEGMPTREAYRSVAEATRASGRADAACLVLGRGADADAVDRWLRLAAPVPGYEGFAVGRTLWWGPLRALLDGQVGDREAVAAIAANLRRLIAVYRAAR